MSRTVAIMQPYFAPYLGYFRLIAETDLLVIYDCVQFPRRGWVHRNRLADATGELDWLTLPLAKAPYDARIDQLAFQADAAVALRERGRRFPAFEALAKGPGASLPELLDVAAAPVGYLETLLRRASESMGLTWNVVRSSTLGLGPAFRRQERILRIAQLVGATTYLNSPGGRDLYQTDVFDRAGISLRLLDPYPGPMTSILQRLHDSDAASLGRELAGLAA